MQALVFDNIGEPSDVLKLTDVAKPNPAPNEVLIKVLGSPIHPADVLFMQGKYRYKPEFPQTAGLEGTGIIEAVGSNVELGVDTLVSFIYRKAWAEYTVVTEDELFVLPNDFPVEKAAQFSLNPMTAWGLLEESGARAGDWLLLTAGNSTVSKITIQLAKLKNIKTIAVVRSTEQIEALKALGTDAVLDAIDDNFTERINDLTAGKGINAALDAVGGKAGTMILKSMAPFGKVVIYGLLSPDPVQFYNAQIIFKNISIQGFGIRGYLQRQTPEQKKEMLQVMIHEIAKPSFQLPVIKKYRLGQFREALKANEQGGREGKILFEI